MGVNSIMNDAGRIGFVVKGTYDNTATYDFLDVIYYNNATYVAKKLTVGNEPQSSSEFWQVLVAGEVDFNDVAPTFLQAKTRENINSGEKLPVLFGKIKKWYTDLKAVAFSGSYNDLSDTPTIPAAVAVKGNAESSYRTGNVNLTPANIGAVPTANVLDSKESITANTASGNVAGALGTKEINANLQSQIDTLNSNLGTWEDITGNCNLGYHQTTTGKIYKNSALRLVSVKLWFSENIGNQEYLCTIGTLPGGVNPEILTFSVNTQNTSGVDNPSIILFYDSTGLRSSHSMNIPAIFPVYTALLKF